MLGASERPTHAAVARRCSGRPALNGPTRVGSHHAAAAASSPGQYSPQSAEFSPKRTNAKQRRPAHRRGPQGTFATRTHTQLSQPPVHGLRVGPSRQDAGLAAPGSWPSGP